MIKILPQHPLQQDISIPLHHLKILIPLILINFFDSLCLLIRLLDRLHIRSNPYFIRILKPYSSIMILYKITPHPQYLTLV